MSNGIIFRRFVSSRSIYKYIMDELRLSTPTLEKVDNQIKGYCLPFDTLSVDLGGFKEKIDKNALDGVDLSNVHLLYQHNPKDVLASSKSGTLSLRSSDKGLYFTATMPDTTLGKDTFELLKRGDIQDMSFGFQVEKDEWNITTSPPTRTIKQIRLVKEISIVTRGAYSNTKVNNCVTNCHISERNDNPIKLEAMEILKSLKQS